MTLPRQPTIISTVLHIILILSVWLFSFRNTLLYNVPLELTEISNRTSTPNLVPEKRIKTKMVPSKTPIAPHTESASEAPADQSKTQSSQTDPDSTHTGPVSEEYEVGEMPILLNEIRIPYPSGAKIRGIQGKVIFDLIVGREGTVVSQQLISSPDPVLTQAAAQAVSQFKFRPARIGDKPVAIKIRYSYRFNIE